MKKILIVDGGPRRAMNTAALCDAFAEGARADSPEIEVERVRLYDLPPYKGCVSCLACKLKGRETGASAPSATASRTRSAPRTTRTASPSLRRSTSPSGRP